MKRSPHTPETSELWESDPVWDLLKQAPAPAASTTFAQDTVRLARLTPPTTPWWKKCFSPAPLAGLAAVTAALALTVTQFPTPVATPATSTTLAAQNLEELAAAEILIAAVDHLEDFSDTELAALIGF